METGQTKGLIFDIQGHSVHDGPGSRTLVFMSGCPLRCAWCCNPEGMQVRQRVMYKAQKCVHCPKRCVDACLRHAISASGEGEDAPVSIDRVRCEGCTSFECVASCYMQALQLSGKWMTGDELMRMFDRDRAYWGGEGGVTFSGGEPLLQKDFVIPMLRRCQDSYIHTTLETSSYVPTDHLLEALKYTNFLFTDIKHMNHARHKEGTGVPNALILHNLRAIAESKWDGRIVIRCPIVPGFNDGVENAEATATFMRDLDFNEINLLPFHRLGNSKYEQLGMTYAYAEQPAMAPEALQDLKAAYEAKGITCYLGSDTPF